MAPYYMTYMTVVWNPLGTSCASLTKRNVQDAKRTNDC